MNISPVCGALGATIEGIQLSNPEPEVLEQIQSALDTHLVLYFPNQSLDRFQLSRLAQCFGPPFMHPLVNNGFSDCPEVLELLRDEDQTSMFGGESWHTDVSWQNPAGYVSILHALEVPDVGGDTSFSSNQAAFDALSDGMKDLLRSLCAVHSYYWYEHREDPDHTVVHPVIRCHPVTGREGIYVNRMFTSRFEDMSVEESEPLLNFLFDHLQKHEFTCRFHWSAGAVIIWDNRFTLHYPINDFSNQRRRMIRTTTLESG